MESALAAKRPGMTRGDPGLPGMSLPQALLHLVTGWKQVWSLMAIAIVPQIYFSTRSTEQPIMVPKASLAEDEIQLPLGGLVLAPN